VGGLVTRLSMIWQL